jgi:hypothetical protein
MEPPPRRRSLVVALFVAISWGAATFAAAGLLAVLLDRDPVETPIPPAAGLGGLALAGTAVWLGSGLTARARSPWVGALGTAAAVWIVIAGASLATSFELFAEQAPSPFVITAAALAGVAAAGTWAGLRGPRDERPPDGRHPKAGLSGPPGRS